VIVIALLGNVDVYVPEGIDVDVGGGATIGHRRDWGRDVSMSDAPTLHVTVLGLREPSTYGESPATLTTEAPSTRSGTFTGLPHCQRQARAPTERATEDPAVWVASMLLATDLR
jgi:hypothetical protein